jgi:hypothetical protein
MAQIDAAIEYWREHDAEIEAEIQREETLLATVPTGE